MLPNKIPGKYELNADGRAGMGAAWVMAALLLPMAAWAGFMFARLSGWLPPTKAHPMWALVWLLIVLPCLLMAAKCFGWKGWRLLGNIVMCLLVGVVLNVLGGLLIAFTLADWLK